MWNQFHTLALFFFGLPGAAHKTRKPASQFADSIALPHPDRFSWDQFRADAQSDSAR
jgi:hypothetical protein